MKRSDVNRSKELEIWPLGLFS